MKTEDRKKKLFLELFLIFLKIGAFTFGGGYAMIPLIQREVAEKKQWISERDILDVVAIAESTPGPIAVNSATFVGCKVGGFWGAFFATFGVVLPSFLIIFAVSFVLRQFESNRIVAYAFYGIRAGVLVLILRALISMYRQSEKNLLFCLLAAGAFVSVVFFDVNVLAVIVICAAAGLITSAWAAGREKS
ncbi:MAG TPA: chromate transporter [Firmicutes bacterium]|nr:chromate transporter [Bacillota bacterium]